MAHTVLPATRCKWTCPTLTLARQTGTRFTYPGGMEGWVDLGAGYIPRWFTCLLTVTHPSTNRARRRVTMVIQTNMLLLRQSFHLFLHSKVVSITCVFGTALSQDKILIKSFFVSSLCVETFYQLLFSIPLSLCKLLIKVLSSSMNLMIRNNSDCISEVKLT